MAIDPKTSNPSDIRQLQTSGGIVFIPQRVFELVSATAGAQTNQLGCSNASDCSGTTNSLMCTNSNKCS